MVFDGLNTIIKTNNESKTECLTVFVNWHMFLFANFMIKKVKN